jgi:hypothetical protein
VDHIFNDHAEEVDVAVTYSVLVDIPQDIGYCKGNLTDLRRILHLSLAKGNPK